MTESGSDAEEALSFEGNLIVDAGPGTGKTHLIAAKAAALVRGGVDPKRILILTFSRRAAAELRDRVLRDGGNACEIRTLHGFASRLLEAGGPRFKTRRLLGSFAESLILQAAIKRAELTTINAITRKSARFRDDAARFASDLRRNERTALKALAETATPRIADLTRIAEITTNLRENFRASDLNDLIARAVEALEDSSSAQSKWLASRYHYLLIDEFQDVDRLQLTLCQRIGGTVFAVGDPAQSIYRFRGAVHGIFHEGAERLGLTPFALQYSRRCPQKICDLAARTPLIDATPLTSLVESPGSITVRAARTTIDEASLIADRIEDAIAAGTRPESIAVLLRSMRPLARAITAELEARRIAVASTGSDAFFNDPEVSVLRLALRALARPHELERWAAFLSAPALGFDAIALRFHIASKHFTAVSDVVEWLTKANLTGSLSSVELAELLTAASMQFSDAQLGRCARTLVRGLRLVEAQTKVQDVVKARTAIARLMRFVDALGEAQLALTSTGENPASAAIVELIDDHADELGSDETPPDDVMGVRVMSIHGAKGLQFELVIIGDAVEGRFPAATRRSTLLGSEDRTALERAKVDVVDARPDDGLIEEASLWYVAVTRTREDLFITYATHGADGTPQRVTRFLPSELHPSEHDAPFERRHERIETALLQSDDASALAVLANLAADSPIVAAMVDHGEAAFDKLEQRDIVLAKDFSVSAAEVWLHCPRQFFYKHALGLKSDDSNAMRSGSAVHKVLERFHREFKEFGPEGGSALPVWQTRLHELRVEQSAEEQDVGPIEIRNARAAAADRLLSLYAQALADEAKRQPFSVLKIECDITIPFPGGILKGRLDRVDRLADGQLILRDYKVGKKHDLEKQLKKAYAGGASPAAGDFVSDFRPQLALYRIGAEQAFDAKVAQLDYIYLKGDDKSNKTANALVILESARLDELQQLETLVAEDFVRAFKEGAPGPLRTTQSETNCRFCDFKRRRLCEGIDG